MRMLHWLMVSSLVLLGALLVACGGDAGASQGPPGLRPLTVVGEQRVRKVVIQRAGTPLYPSPAFETPTEVAELWDFLFVYEDKLDGPYEERYYAVSRYLSAAPNELLYVRKSEVFEWNHTLCLRLAKPSSQTNRPLVHYYETREGALRGEGVWRWREKENAQSSLARVDMMPILSIDHEDNSVFYVAALYDDTLADGSTVFRGSFNFAYVRFIPGTHEIVRYVHRDELAQQLKALQEEMNLLGSEPIKPDRWQRLSDLFAEFIGTYLPGGPSEEDRIQQMQQSGDIPSEVLETLPNAVQVSDTLGPMIQQMEAFLNTPSYWDKYGFAFIQPEWMQ